MTSRAWVCITLFTLAPVISHAAEPSCANLPTCSGGTKEIKLCIIDPDVVPNKWNLLGRLIEHNNCEGTGRRDIVVSSPAELKNIFRDTIAKCERIKDLRFAGHGAPGYTAAGRITSDNLSSLRELNCAMAPLATIDILGCNTGRGCLGQLFMFNVAKNLLPQGGDVIGTTYYASVILPRPKHISLDGGRRILQVRPGTKEPEKWLIDNPVRVRQTTTGDSCTSELDEALQVFENHEKYSSMSNGCKIPDDSNIRVYVDSVRKRRDAILEIDANSKTFAPIADATSGWWHQGKLGGFSGISDAALGLVQQMQPYLSCRRKRANGRIDVKPAGSRDGEISQ